MKSLPIFLLLLAAAPALAQEPGAAEPAASEKRDPRAPDSVRCRSIAVTGSLVKKERICKTNAEWAKSSDQMRDEADDLITRSRTLNNSGG